MKSLWFLLMFIVLSGCGVISKQYYYVPSARHKTIRAWYGYNNSRAIYAEMPILNQAGDSLGAIVTTNGAGHPLLMGPFVPVVPVGGFFDKVCGKFRMDVFIKYNKGYAEQLAIDSNNYKRERAGSDASGTGPCYMIVNDTAKIVLEGREWTSLMFRGASHGYMLTGNVRFRKVQTLRLVTGNMLLDSTLKNVTFTRKSRIKFDLLGPGY